MRDPGPENKSTPESKRFERSTITDWGVPIVLGLLGIGLISVMIIIALAIFGVI